MTKNIKGKFISIEGVEGAGKSTVMKYLASFLQSHNIDFIQTREPGGTDLGEKIRELLLDKSNTRMHADTELMLMFAARAQHWHELILPTLDSGKWVISDRFTDSSFAYQGGGRELDYSRISKLADWTLGNVKPDKTLLLDIEPEIGMRRVNQRGPNDRFESEKIEFFIKVRKAFLELATKEPARFVIIDSAKSIEDTQLQAKSALESML